MEKLKDLLIPVLNTISNVSFKVNADNGFAHRAISLGMEKLVPSARENGISSLAITNSYNCGVLGYHTKNIAKAKVTRKLDLPMLLLLLLLLEELNQL